MNTLKQFKPFIQIELHVGIMGNEKTKSLLTDLYSIGYEIKYFIPRDLDVPIIGRKRDIQKISFEKLFSMIDKNEIPHYIMLILKNSKAIENEKP